jgi:hypothetical protein
MYTAKDATAKWNMSPEQIEHFNTLRSPHDMSDYLKEIAIENNLVRPLDAGSLDILVDVPQSAPVAASETKTVTIDGKVFTGDQATIDAAMKAAFVTEKQNEQPARDRNGRYTAEPVVSRDPKVSDAEAQKAADKAMLDLRFKRGEIDTATYLRESNAMSEYLASVGIDVNAAQQQAQRDSQEVTNWATATEQFKKNNPDWPGGERLMARMADKIDKLGLTDYPSAESLERCQAAIALEDQMETCTDSRKMAELQELYRIHVEGRSGVPDYRR